MRILTLAPLFVLILIGGQGSFFDELAYARHNANHCCMCGKCYSYCWCSGQANCKVCHSDDGENILSTVSADNLTIDLRQTAQLQAPKLVKSDVNGRVITLVRGNRLRGNFTMKLIDHVVDYMKFKCMSLES